MDTPYELIITLDPPTLDTLKQGQYKLYLGPADPETVEDSALPGPHAIDRLNHIEFSELPTTTTSINTTWTSTDSGTTPAYMISYSFNLLDTADKITEALTKDMIPDPVDATSGEAFKLITSNEKLTKIPVATPWVLPMTIGFQNSIKAQPLLFLKVSPDPKKAKPLFWAPSIWLPGRGRLHTQKEAAVWAWFANSTPEDSNGIDTVDFSMAKQLKFRPGKGITIPYLDSNPNGWGQQVFTTPEPVVP